MISLFFKVKTSTIFIYYCVVWEGIQGRCTLVRVILLLLDKSSMVEYVITTNITYYGILLITASVYCYLIELVGN